jgi:hypothetical protein
VTSSPAKPHSDLEELARVELGLMEAGVDGLSREWWTANLIADEVGDGAEFIAACSPARVLSLIGEVRELQQQLELAKNARDKYFDLFLMASADATAALRALAGE